MGILLGLDLGEKRVGVARSDETETIAEALATITYQTKEHLVSQLKSYFEELAPEKIVVGMPQTLRGEMGFAARKVTDLTEWLKERLPGNWIFWDERFTTVEAEEILLEANLSPSKRKGIRDRVAAQRILQSYLNSKHV